MFLTNHDAFYERVQARSKLIIIFISLATFAGGFLVTNNAYAAFAPSDIANLKLWMDATSGVYSDNGITPAVDGATVQQWNDRSISFSTTTQATAGNRPTYKTNIINGLPVIRFNGSSNNLVTSSFLDSSFNTSFSFFIVTTKRSIGLTVATSNQGAKWYSGAQSNTIMANTGNLSPSQSTTSPLGSYLQPTIETFRYDGAQVTIRFNGASTASVLTTGNLGLSGSLTIGSLSTNAFYYDGDIAEIIIYNGVLNDAQIEQVESYLGTKYGISVGLPSTSIPIFAFDGDSMTYGIGSTAGFDYPTQTQSLLGITATYQNLGLPSQTVSTLTSYAPTRLDPEYSGLRTTNIDTLLGGTNDLYFGATAVTTYNNIVSYSQGRRTAGFKVIVNTILPRSNGGTPGTFEADRQTVNGLIRANWQTFADGISDVATSTIIGSAGASSNTTYYADGVHMTNTGYGFVASYVTAAIKQIMDPISVSDISIIPSTSTVAITWTTNQAGSTKINYGSTSSYGLSTTEIDMTTRVLNHNDSVSNLIACTTYDLQTVSTDLNGNQATSTNQSFTTIGCLPGAPIITAPIVLSSSSIRWNFTDNSSDETGFRIYDDIDTLVKSSATANLTYLDETGLSENTQYSGRYATAYNSYGHSASSSASTAKYTLADIPTNLSASSNSNSVTLSVDSFPNDTSGQSGYYFSRSGVNSDWIQTNSWIDTGLSCGISYEYSVKYRNGDGTETSEISTTKSTSACPSSSSGGSSARYIPPVQNATTTIATSTQLIIARTFFRDLKLGMTGDDVKELQRLLNKQGFNIASSGLGSPGNETNFFGLLTQKALIKFQTFHNISPAIGYFGPLTRAFVNGTQAPSTASFSTTTSPFTRNLTYGSTGEDVRWLQIFLNSHGYTGATDGPGSLGNETNYFGQATKSALIKFQVANNVTPAVGFFGPMTRKVVEGTR